MSEEQWELMKLRVQWQAWQEFLRREDEAIRSWLPGLLASYRDLYERHQRARDDDQQATQEMLNAVNDLQACLELYADFATGRRDHLGHLVEQSRRDEQDDVPF